MIVRSLNDVANSPQHVSGPGWESRRILLKRDGLGYSFHDTILLQGTELTLKFEHHIETNYCIEGEGEVIDVATGDSYRISPGVIYVLDRHDEHILRALKGDLRLICIFTPALAGPEIHTDTGGYQLLD